MHISELIPGEQKGPIEGKIKSRNKVHQSLLRIQIADSTGRINIIFEGQTLAKTLENLRLNTLVRLTDFIVTEDDSPLKKYFPDFIDSSNIATLESSASWYILISQSYFPFPAILLEFNQNLINIDSESELSEVNLNDLYKPRLSSSPQKVSGPNNERYTNLSHIRDSVGETPIVSSCYAVVIDSTRSYYQPNSTDYLITLKVTDETIYPEVSNLVIFHKNYEEVPKVESIGDVIRLDQFQFKKYQNYISITGSSGAKLAKFFLFKVGDESLAPYACYHGKFTQNPAHHTLLSNKRNWARTRFQAEVPKPLAATIALSEVSSQEEKDLLARVYGTYPLGVGKKDPIVLIVYDRSCLAQAIVPREKEKIVKWLESGDNIRMRSVRVEDSRISVSIFTDIMKVSEHFPLLQVPSRIEKEAELAKLASYYQVSQEHKLKTMVHPSLKSLPVLAYSQVPNLSPGAECRVEGYVVKITPGHPKDQSGLQCPNCNTKTHLEICDCGSETDVMCDVSFNLWDGSQNEKSLIKVTVKEGACKAFFRGEDWENIVGQLLKPESKVELGIQVEEEGFYVFKTYLNIRN